MKMLNFSKILTPVSPEIAKKDRQAAADTFKVSIDTIDLMRGWGLYTDESIAIAGQTLAKEAMDITLEIEEDAGEDTGDEVDSEETREETVDEGAEEETSEGVEEEAMNA